MSVEKSIKKRICYAIFGWLFAFISISAPIVASNPVYAEPDPEVTEVVSDPIPINDFKGDVCKSNLGSVGWLVCPVMDVVSNAVDSLYDTIKTLLIIEPLRANDSSPIYIIWKYCLGIANMLFALFILVIVASQITGYGIANYGIKKALPKIIISAIVVNLSFIICTLAVDACNIIGGGLRQIFESVPIAIAGQSVSNIPMQDVIGAVLGSATIGGIAFAVGASSLWMLIPTILGGLVAVVSGLITIALRQTVVTLLVMIAPLAIVCTILPNTSIYYIKWKKLLTKMLVFYPTFSLLFGASSLAGWAIIANGAKDPENGIFLVILGLAVQIMPLFFSWSLMKMSDTFLGEISTRIRKIADRPLATNRAWAESRRANTQANTIAHGTLPSASLQRYLAKRQALHTLDTKNAQSITESRSQEYAQRRIAGVDVGVMNGANKRIASHYTRNAKIAKNESMSAQNATSHAEHVMGNYGSYYQREKLDQLLNKRSEETFKDFGRAAFVREIDDENDINFLTNQFLNANKRDANNRPVDEEAFNRYVRSVGGKDGEQRVLAKIVAQAAKVESKQRSEYAILQAKYGHNGYNKSEFRDWMVGYKVNDDGWAVDADGERFREADGSFTETIQGELLHRDPKRLILYDKRDEKGLYYDMKDQNGNIVARIHRGKGDDGQNYDDAAFIKETLTNYDIPIGDPINNVYNILSGVQPGSIPDAPDIGLDRYSTTIGRAMSTYKGNAAWAGAMHNSMVGNRQIKNSAQSAIAILDSIVKTLKPGAFNTQNPASVQEIMTILDPRNWDRIFSDELLEDACNINNELIGGERYEEEVQPDGSVKTRIVKVDNPSHEERMNKIKRKYLIPAMQKVLPAFDRLRTSNTADNQKPGTADEQYKFIKMVEDQWINNPEITSSGKPVDITLRTQDLPNEVREFRKNYHDADGNPIYPEHGATNRVVNPRLMIDEINNSATDVDNLKFQLFQLFDSNPSYARATEALNDYLSLYPEATMRQIMEHVEDEILPLI